MSKDALHVKPEAQVPSGKKFQLSSEHDKELIYDIGYGPDGPWKTKDCDIVKVTRSITREQVMQKCGSLITHMAARQGHIWKVPFMNRVLKDFDDASIMVLDTKARRTILDWAILFEEKMKGMAEPLKNRNFVEKLVRVQGAATICTWTESAEKAKSVSDSPLTWNTKRLHLIANELSQRLHPGEVAAIRQCAIAETIFNQYLRDQHDAKCRDLLAAQKQIERAYDSRTSRVEDPWTSELVRGFDALWKVIFGPEAEFPKVKGFESALPYQKRPLKRKAPKEPEGQPSATRQATGCNSI
jgi:hypothetical protein